MRLFFLLPILAYASLIFASSEDFSADFCRELSDSTHPYRSPVDIPSHLFPVNGEGGNQSGKSTPVSPLSSDSKSPTVGEPIEIDSMKISAAGDPHDEKYTDNEPCHNSRPPYGRPLKTNIKNFLSFVFSALIFPFYIHEIYPTQY